MSQSNLVVVQSYGAEGEAEVAKGLLESWGIDAMIQADTAGRMRAGWDIECLRGKRTPWLHEGSFACLKAVNSCRFKSVQPLAQPGILQGALLSAGVFATIRDDGANYQLLVSKEDAAAALEVLKTLSEERP